MEVSIRFDARPRDVYGRFIREYSKYVHTALFNKARQRTREITVWMQDNATWNDRTGTAREELQADVELIYGKAIEFYFFYDPVEERETGDKHYAVYLESMQGGRFSILGPTLDHWGPILMQDVREVLRGGR